MLLFSIFTNFKSIKLPSFIFPRQKQLQVLFFMCKLTLYQKTTHALLGEGILMPGMIGKSCSKH